MQNRFLSVLKEFGFYPSQQPILVAVSGGVDSMVLAALFFESGIAIGIAHCNYQLRGEASDKDEKLVRNWCSDKNIPFHLARIDTEGLAKTTNHSIQMVARNERYRFFNELLNSYNYSVTALAHHADDRVETLLMNILRGTGIRGLHGMPSKRKGIIRPLIGCTKEEIRDYAREKQIPHREDTSNAQTYYQRNWVRLRLIPMLTAKDESVVQKLEVFSKNVEKLLPEFENWVNAKLSVIVNPNGISIENLKDSEAPFTLLKEYLKTYGFSSDLVFEVLAILDSNSGTEVDSASHRVIKDRSYLLVEEIDESQTKPSIKLENFNRQDISTLKTDENVALVDAEMVNPSELTLRNWEQGDRFKPLGMKGWKKLSDFFIDEKISVSEKEKIWLLTHNENIIWVVGMRLDNRFKVSSKTQKVLKITVCR